MVVSPDRTKLVLAMDGLQILGVEELTRNRSAEYQNTITDIAYSLNGLQLALLESAISTSCIFLYRGSTPCAVAFTLNGQYPAVGTSKNQSNGDTVCNLQMYKALNMFEDRV